MQLTGPVLVGTDFSAASDEALRQGYDLARDVGTTLIACHVVPELDTVDVLFPHLGARNTQHRDLLTEKAVAAVERQVVDRIGTAADVKPVVDSGTPHAGLLAQADRVRAGLIVMGPGHTAERVLRHANVPAMIARPSGRGPVIGATDFSDPSLPALELAAAEARRRGSRLLLLHVVDFGTFSFSSTAGAAGVGPPFVHGFPGMSPTAIDDVRTAAQDRLREALVRFGVDGEAMAEAGPAAQTIVAFAASVSAELVVVGTHGRTGLARLTLGSTAEAVSRSAPCSVLVVRLTA